MDAAPATRTITAGEVVRESFSIYRDNAGALLGSAFVVFVLVGVLSGLLQNDGGLILLLLAGIIQLAASALYTGFVVKLVDDVRDGRRDHSVGDLISSAAPAIVPLIAFGVLFGIGVTLGLVLLIVPGLILLTHWSLGPPAIVVEDAGPLEAFGRSWELVRGYAWSVFGTLVVVLLIVIAIGAVLAVIATPIGNGATIVASIASNVITAPIFALAVSVMFFDLGGGRRAEAPAPTEPPPPPAPAV